MKGVFSPILRYNPAPMQQVTVIIPALNEEKAIGSVLEGIAALKIDTSVIVVDDGSTDSTGEIARSKGVRVLRHPAPLGYGKSMKDALLAIDGDVVIIVDADGTYPIDRIPDFLACLEQGYDMVVGARQGKEYHGSFFKKPARKIFQWLAEFTTGQRIPDVNSGMRAFHRRAAVQFFPDLCNGFSFTTTITLVYLLNGKSIAYLPISYAERVGRSKVRMFHDSLRTLQYLTEAIIHHNPLKLFLLLTITTLLLGIFGMTWFGVSSLWSGLFNAILVCSMGLIAESMRRPRQ
jgi:glycosyltransferase involved in cell wall biosynthesis